MIVISKDGRTKVQILHEDAATKKCFSGIDTETGNASSCWLISKFDFDTLEKQQHIEHSISDVPYAALK